jgi:hypothetical protein
MGGDTRRGLRDLRRATGRHFMTTRTNQELPCVANTAESSKAFGSGGFQLEADLSVFIDAAFMPADHATNGPKEKQQWTFSRDGKVYKIDHKSLLPGDGVWKFTCTDPNKGA